MNSMHDIRFIMIAKLEGVSPVPGTPELISKFQMVVSTFTDYLWAWLISLPLLSPVLPPLYSLLSQQVPLRSHHILCVPSSLAHHSPERFGISLESRQISLPHSPCLPSIILSFSVLLSSVLLLVHIPCLGNQNHNLLLTYFSWLKLFNGNIE